MLQILNNFIVLNFYGIFKIIIKDQNYQVRLIKNNKTLDFNKNGEITEEDFVFYVKLKEGISDV